MSRRIFQRGLTMRQRWNRLTWKPKALVIGNNPISVAGWMSDMHDRYGPGFIPSTPEVEQAEADPDGQCGHESATDDQAQPVFDPDLLRLGFFRPVEKPSKKGGDPDHAGECGTRCVWGDKRCPVVNQAEVKDQ